MNVICPKCKTINSHDTKFCKNCGTNIEEEVKKVLEAEVIKQVAQEEARRVAQEEMAREKQKMEELRASTIPRGDYQTHNAQMNTRANPRNNPNMQNPKNSNNIPQPSSNETNWGTVAIWSVIGIALTYGFISFMTGGSPKEPSNDLIVKQPTTQQQMIEPNNSNNVLPTRNEIINGATQMIEEVTPQQQPAIVEQPRQRPATQTTTQTQPTTQTPSSNEENTQSNEAEAQRDVSTQEQEQSSGGGYNSGDNSSYYMKKNAYKLITGNKISDESDIKIRNNSKGATIYCLKDDSVCKTEQEVNDFAEKR